MIMATPADSGSMSAAVDDAHALLARLRLEWTSQEVIDVGVDVLRNSGSRRLLVLCDSRRSATQIAERALGGSGRDPLSQREVVVKHLHN